MNTRAIAFIGTLLATWLTHTAAAHAVEVDFTASQVYEKGETVKVEVRATGPVLVSSDFDRSSVQLEVIGTKVVEVGKVAGPGFARITVSDDREEAFLDVVVLPEGAKLRFVVGRGKIPRNRTAEVRKTDQSTLAKFVKAIDKAKAKKALAEAAPAWAAENAVQLGTSTVVCLLTLAEPIAVKYCKDGALDVVGGFGLTFLEKLVDQVDGHGLTKTEAQTVRGWIKLAAAASLVTLDKKALDELDELLGKLSSVIGEMEFKDEKVKIIVKSGVDLAHKYVLIVKIAKP